MAKQQKISVGGLTFDAVLKTSHASKVTTTSHPIESGANITDHTFVDPAEVTIEIGMTDCNGVGVSDDMFKSLQSLQNSRRPMTILTRFKKYTNMLIISMSVPDDYTTMNALKAVLMCREILIVGAATVKVAASGQGQKSGSTNSGTKQAQSASQSVSKQANSLLLA